LAGLVDGNNALCGADEEQRRAGRLAEEATKLPVVEDKTFIATLLSMEDEPAHGGAVCAALINRAPAGLCNQSMK